MHSAHCDIDPERKNDVLGFLISVQMFVWRAKEEDKFLDLRTGAEALKKLGSVIGYASI